MVDLENNSKQEESLLFLHIPKAGGSTLTTILDKQYQKQEVYKIRELKDLDILNNADKKSKNQFKVITGHFPFGLHEDLLQKCSYITMLREPTERLISLYYYIRSSVEHRLHQQIVSKQMTLEEFVSSGILETTDNCQTRLISGQMEVEFGCASQEMLAMAKDNLQKMAVVGILENFDETLVLIKKNLGWQDIFYTKKNITRSRLSQQEIPQSTLKVIEEYSQLDRELYNYAKGILKQQIAKEQPSFALELSTFKLLNRSHKMYFDLKAKTKSLVRG
ncbi:MAG: sulfotransferase family 2 domain-containing protein [Spirulinaceae cyanobacterium]